MASDPLVKRKGSTSAMRPSRRIRRSASGKSGGNSVMDVIVPRKSYVLYHSLATAYLVSRRQYRQGWRAAPAGLVM
jgi:hypothetical protein